jgi:hypothetical protein
MARGAWTGRSDLWTPEQIKALRELYTGTLKLGDIDRFAASIGRLKSNVSRKAREMGLTKRGRRYGRKDKRKFKGDREALSRHISARRRSWISKNGHPRGALGMKHTEATKWLIAAKSLERNARMTQRQRNAIGIKAAQARLLKYGTAGPPLNVTSAYSRAKKGRRPDLENKFFRSGWEANYARWLNWLIRIGEVKSWTYETTTFRFDGIKRGTLTYTPDFDVVLADGSIEYHEVKGWMDKKSETRLRRMKKYHPKARMVLIDAKRYHGIAKKAKALVPHWEGK